MYKCNARQFETYKFVNNKITWVVDELSDNALWQYYNSCSTKNVTKKTFASILHDQEQNEALHYQ